MRIIPAIDVIDGKCVRLSMGDYSQKKIYNENPLEVAKQFEDAGLKYLHLVDLDGAKIGKIVNFKMLEKICKNTTLSVDYGGGLKTKEDVDLAFNSGAAQINIGSLAVKNPDLVYEWILKYGFNKIILSADVKNELIAINGWQSETKFDVFSFISKFVERSLSYVVCTDISKDGMLQGPSFDLYKKIIQLQPNLKLIASGGVSCYQDILDLKEAGLEGVIVGKAIYENRINIVELSKKF